MSAPHDALLFAALFMFAIGVAFLSSAIAAHQRGKRAAYYSQRRASRRHSSRQGMRALAAFALGAVLLIAAEVVRVTEATPPLPSSVTPTAMTLAGSLATARGAQAPTPQPVPTLTPSPMPMPTLQLATSAPLLTPTSAPEVELVPLSATPTSTPISDLPLPERRLQLVGLAEALDERGLPLNPSTRFISGTRSIFIVFEYRNVPPNALLRHTWFHNGNSVHFDSTQLPLAATGIGHITWAPEGGFAPGTYEVHVVIGNVLQFIANFEVSTA
ncbi:MAG: hypothetical protein RMJ86_03065 [Anaerolineae bacterium]|nr:hypothetical protein [Thermoflexales bacterium]MDW8053512.1 hypothetical protein [Anaerolineae bacterium]